ncbi:MAG: FixH family protein [Rhodospirillaceae bacterium]|nr:FixH family protein [Rhodospirillaceae bacterium]MBL6930193.1 FixH family protein [Rhodospirillales bacterium]MBL6942115.1 FixH family protein [Rhodospirillales bacterium]
MPGSNASSRKPLWLLIGGFSIALIANAALVYFATSSWTGLETKQHYAKGLAYNDNLDGAKRQQALGWQDKTTVTFTTAETVSGTSEIRFSSKDGKNLDDLEVWILATRPTNEGYDREFTLAAAGDGVYRGAFTLPLKGQWDFRILARRGDSNYQRVERIVTP